MAIETFDHANQHHWFCLFIICWLFCSFSSWLNSSLLLSIVVALPIYSEGYSCLFPRVFMETHVDRLFEPVCSWLENEITEGTLSQLFQVPVFQLKCYTVLHKTQDNHTIQTQCTSVCPHLSIPFRRSCPVLHSQWQGLILAEQPEMGWFGGKVSSHYWTYQNNVLQPQSEPERAFWNQ